MHFVFKEPQMVHGCFFIPKGATAEEKYRLLEKWKPRQSDLFLFGFVKSGTHWVWEILMMLLASSPRLVDAPKELFSMDRWTTQELEKRRKKGGIPCVFNSHMERWAVPPIVRRQRTVVVIRNPKDVLVSSYHHARFYRPKEQIRDFDSWDDFFDLWIKVIKGETPGENWFESVKTWWQCKNDPNVHIVFYEDLKKNPRVCIERMCTFLGLSVSWDVIEGIVESTSFEFMERNKVRLVPTGVRTARDSLYMEEGMKMFRKGVVGDWMNHFTPEQNEIFDQLYETHMAGVDVPIQFTL